MVSVDWKKNKGGTNEGFARMAHATRHDGKEVEYNNKHIKPELSHLNYEIRPRESKKRTAVQEINRLKQRVEQLDQLQPPRRVRKDRVTTVSFEIKVPDALQEKDERRFFQLAYEEIARTCGGVKNVTNGYVHNDEKHEYLDPLKKEFVMSRAHMHVQGIVWTAEHGVNGKHFVTRQRMRELNQRLEERCRRELGISFLKEEQSQHHEKWVQVEDLKRESSLALEKKLKEQEELNIKLKDYNGRLIEKAEKIQRYSELQQRQLDELGFLDRLKVYFSKPETDRAFALAEDLTKKRTEELERRVRLAESKANEVLERARELEVKNKTLSEEKEFLARKTRALEKDNIRLRGVLDVLQKGFEKVESFLKKLTLNKANAWAVFRSEYRNQDYNEYQKFQGIRHDPTVGGMPSKREEQVSQRVRSGLDMER